MIVSGASQGVGLAISKRFTEAGAKVIMADINEDLGIAESEKIGADFIKIDVSKEDDVKSLVDYVIETYGTIDALINNAAIIIPEEDVPDIDVETAKKLFDINYFGYFRMIKYCAPYMPSQSAIINLASNAGVQAFPGYAAYNSSKGAIILLTRTVALELADRGIRVNSICPASIDTPMLYQEVCENELK
ncbi:hypothetical protein AZF37_01270 [endosymbiont 'TC1' of Trimyema compressum]|uniref:SDR family NAD(P)-dependent oxidoreductase n=1 Tax=endosymbiont 'TC1' of Trimyema compressum TaxID=243899 RepID=UPI0007F0B66B|nr:SDR family oxidoreductase [endosymbiont 'TC1' of Trimyema compressum]AMP19990.1 hypothetical protein AZF37_01270 [endosymbiont 'TC1' of Trimyema compressum]